jgi:thiamine phosphate synthase YjbQ (UPF0047 family)
MLLALFKNITLARKTEKTLVTKKIENTLKNITKDIGLSFTPMSTTAELTRAEIKTINIKKDILSFVVERTPKIQAIIRARNAQEVTAPLLVPIAIIPTKKRLIMKIMILRKLCFFSS